VDEAPRLHQTKASEHHVSFTGLYSYCRRRWWFPCHARSALSGYTRAAIQLPAALARAAAAVTKAAEAAVATAAKAAAAAAAAKGKEAKAYHTSAPAADRYPNSSQDAGPSSRHHSVQPRCC